LEDADRMGGDWGMEEAEEEERREEDEAEEAAEYSSFSNNLFVYLGKGALAGSALEVSEENALFTRFSLLLTVELGLSYLESNFVSSFKSYLESNLEVDFTGASFGGDM
jgi:hypothetical protein